MPRGGPRQGTPGQAYGNRTDLQGPAAAGAGGSSRPYGAGGSAPPSLPLPEGPSAPGGAPAPPASPMPTPGGHGPLSRPSEAPGEPITAGAGFGPGPGPGARGALAPGAMGPTPDMQALAQYLPVLELLAMRPNTSNKVRNLVRKMKAFAPVDPGSV